MPVGVARRPNECANSFACLRFVCGLGSAIDHVCQAALGNITYQPWTRCCSSSPFFLLPPSPTPFPLCWVHCNCSCLCLLSLPAYFAIFLISLMDLCAAVATLAQSCLCTPSAPLLHSSWSCPPPLTSSPYMYPAVPAFVPRLPLLSLSLSGFVGPVQIEFSLNFCAAKLAVGNKLI